MLSSKLKSASTPFSLSASMLSTLLLKSVSRSLLSSDFVLSAVMGILLIVHP